MPKKIDMTGKSFGRFVVLNEMRGKGAVKVMWLCLCSCGAKKLVDGSALRSGHTQSCGCQKIEKATKRLTTHGMSKTSPLYATWVTMKSRCLDPKSKGYKFYGERGITICDRWKNSFSAFVEDMGNRPGGYSIERMNNDGPYSPDNCRWATRFEQANNKCNNRKITFRGTTKTVSEWSDKTGIKRNTLYTRLYVRGWSIEKSLTGEEG